MHAHLTEDAEASRADRDLVEAATWRGWVLADRDQIADDEELDPYASLDEALASHPLEDLVLVYPPGQRRVPWLCGDGLWQAPVVWFEEHGWRLEPGGPECSSGGGDAIIDDLEEILAAVYDAEAVALARAAWVDKATAAWKADGL